MIIQYAIKKAKHLLSSTLNHRLKFRKRNWIEKNDDARGTYSTNSQINFKTPMVKSSLCNYSDAYILVKGRIIVVGQRAAAAVKNCALFTDCISEY